AKIEHGREIHVETESANGFANHAAVAAKKLAVAGGGNFGGGGRGREHIAQAIHRAAFHVNTAKQRSGDAGVALGEQIEGLGRVLNGAGEQDDAAGLECAQQDVKRAGGFSGVEAGDKELAAIEAEVSHC